MKKQRTILRENSTERGQYYLREMFNRTSDGTCKYFFKANDALVDIFIYKNGLRHGSEVVFDF